MLSGFVTGLCECFAEAGILFDPAPEAVDGCIAVTVGEIGTGECELGVALNRIVHFDDKGDPLNLP